MKRFSDLPKDAGSENLSFMQEECRREGIFQERRMIKVWQNEEDFREEWECPET